MDYNKIDYYRQLKELKRRVKKLENATTPIKASDIKLEYVFVRNDRKGVYWVCGLEWGLEVWKETFSGRNALQRATARFNEVKGEEKTKCKNG